MTKLDRMEMKINREFVYVFKGLYSVTEINRMLGTLSLINAWGIVIDAVADAEGNKIVIDASFRKEAAKLLGHSDPMNFNKALRKLNDMGLIMKSSVEKNVYYANPILTFYGRFSKRMRAIIDYYADGRRDVIIDRFEETYFSLSEMDDVIEEALYKAGLGEKSTNPEDLKYL